MGRNSLGGRAIFQIIACGIASILLFQIVYAAGLHTLTGGNHAFSQVQACQARACLASASQETANKSTRYLERISFWTAHCDHRRPQCYRRIGDAPLRLSAPRASYPCAACAAAAGCRDERPMVVMWLLSAEDKGLGQLLPGMRRALEGCLPDIRYAAANRSSQGQGPQKEASVPATRSLPSWTCRYTAWRSATSASRTSRWQGCRQGQGEGRSGQGSPRTARCGADAHSDCRHRSQDAGDDAGAERVQGQLAGQCASSDLRAGGEPYSLQGQRDASPGRGTDCQAEEVGQSQGSASPVLTAVAQVRGHARQDLADAGRGKRIHHAGLCGFRGHAGRRDLRCQSGSAAASREPAFRSPDGDGGSRGGPLVGDATAEADRGAARSADAEDCARGRKRRKRDGSRTPRRHGKEAVAELPSAADHQAQTVPADDVAMKQALPSAPAGKPHSQDLS